MKPDTAPFYRERRGAPPPGAGNHRRLRARRQSDRNAGHFGEGLSFDARTQIKPRPPKERLLLKRRVAPRVGDAQEIAVRIVSETRASVQRIENLGQPV